jgi:hypothetical protein
MKPHQARESVGVWHDVQDEIEREVPKRPGRLSTVWIAKNHAPGW